MSDFGYVNARLRSMRAKRIPPKQYETLAGFTRIEELGDWLATGPYATAYGRAVERYTGLKAVDRAISERLHDILSHCVRMVQVDRGSPLAVYLSRIDYENLKVVARAVVAGEGYDHAAPGLVSVPPLDEAALRELCEREDLQGVASLLMTWGHPAGPAVARFLRSEPTGEAPRLDRLDRALESTYFTQGMKVLLENEEEGNEALVDALRDEIDLDNLRAALKTAFGGGGELADPPLTYGRLQPAFLQKIASCRDLPDALEHVRATVYHQALSQGAAEAAREGDLGSLERTFERIRLQRLSRNAVTHPIGMGFTIRFLAETMLEAQNLRLAARAAAGLIPAQAAQEAMIRV